jgi:hypothetical protein
MRRTSVNFLGRIRRRDLLDFPEELQGMRGDFFGVECGGRIGPERFAIRVVGVGFESETHGAGVALAAARIKTREARGAAQGEHQDAGGERVESAEVTDAAKTDDAAHGFDDIVRGFAGRFVNDNDPVEGGRFGWTRHNLLDFDKGRFSDVISQEWIEIHAMRGKRTIAGA